MNGILGGIIYYIHFINTTEKEKIYAKVNSVLVVVFIWLSLGNIGSFFG